MGNVIFDYGALEDAKSNAKKIVTGWNGIDDYKTGLNNKLKSSLDPKSFLNDSLIILSLTFFLILTTITMRMIAITIEPKIISHTLENDIEVYYGSSAQLIETKTINVLFK